MNISIRKDPIYGNCEVYSPDNILMFRCTEKRALWYVNKTNAEIIGTDPIKVKIKFKPNGLGYNNDEYGLAKMKNICVVCGKEHELTRHHIVPTMFKKHMPENYTSHNFYDVIPLCHTCHTSYEDTANVLKSSLFEQFDIANKINTDYLYFSKLAKTYKNVTNLPNERKLFLENRISNYLSENDIVFTSFSDAIDYLITLNQKAYEDIRSVGKLVVDRFNDNQKFVELWRKHFIDNAKPKFMPDNWRIDRNIYVR